jgi:hypothetical protein
MKSPRQVFHIVSYAHTRWFLIVACLLTILYMGLGLISLFWVSTGPLHDLAYGLISLGVGFVGLLKGATEIAENLQKQS